MSLQPKSRMTFEAYLAWAEGRDGRYELVDGEVIAMSPERVGHARLKSRAHRALQRAIEKAGLDCEALPDGVTVQVDARTAFEPDALVQCGERLADDMIAATNPVIVVEVLSPGTKHVDTGKKLEGYFRVPSIRHYLIVDPDRRVVIHHRRGAGDLIETRIASSGRLELDPPGLVIAIADLFEGESG